METKVHEYVQGNVFLGVPWTEDANLEELDLVYCDSDSETIWIDGRVAAIMSLQLLWTGVASVSMMVNEYARANPISFTRAVHFALEVRVHNLDLRKVYSVIDSSRHRLHRWITHLGFEKEYVMTEAGPEKQDMVGYSKIFKEV